MPKVRFLRLAEYSMYTAMSLILIFLIAYPQRALPRESLPSYPQRNHSSGDPASWSPPRYRTLPASRRVHFRKRRNTHRPLSRPRGLLHHWGWVPMATSSVVLIWFIKWNRRNPVWGHCKAWEPHRIKHRSSSPRRRGFSSSFELTFCGQRSMLFWTSVLPLAHLPYTGFAVFYVPVAIKGFESFVVSK